ncbi:uncharacterized protein DUF4157 [Chitinophaga niastensis]|uniref:Uncharacterized protein DUF4157 n=1 Tax=Chitinophaga niastensis TaxID=536980 RepID=A0A2P8HDL5_CHINA|nr:DUF4157 domain-containing protein [Chitinophaga niastensis]PSL44325.1 uncharacterized protein DUF4157 [Chitinophaga niastensis]
MYYPRKITNPLTQSAAVREPVCTHTAPVQAKLTVNTPGDTYEQEADSVADKVMRMPEIAAPAIQRKCATCEEEEKDKHLQLKPLAADITSMVQRKEGGEGQAAGESVAAALQHSKGSSEALPDRTRSWMENRFGTTFGHVRIHTDANAVQLSRDVSAQAFTHGHDIYFNEGKFAPDTTEGKHLLAHELTHVVQQRGTEQIQRAPAQPAAPVQISPEEKEKNRKEMQAEFQFWKDLKNWFPDDGRKIAGSGYDDSIDYLFTNLDNKPDPDGTENSVPMVYVGKKYLAEQNADKRKALIKTELEKIDKYRYDNALIDDQDLNNPAVMSKIKALTISEKTDYANKMAKQQFVANKDILEFIRKMMPSTALPAGATATRDGGYTVQFKNIKIVVKPDVLNSKEVKEDAAHTQILRTDSDTYNSRPKYNYKGEKITEVGATHVPQLVYTIQSHYGTKSGPDNTSGYGVGTRPGDTGINKTLRGHEGSHGTAFINFISNNIAAHPFPVFTGKVNDPKTPFETGLATYESSVLAFDQMLKDALETSIQSVDCVGTKTIEQFYTDKGEVSDVKCNM